MPERSSGTENEINRKRSALPLLRGFQLCRDRRCQASPIRVSLPYSSVVRVLSLPAPLNAVQHLTQFSGLPWLLVRRLKTGSLSAFGQTIAIDHRSGNRLWMNDMLLPSHGQYFEDSAVRGGLDLLVFAHKSHLQRADDELDALGLGRAHHRMLYVAARRPGMMTSELIDVLQVTKQSAARVLSSLVDKGYLRQVTCEHDRRRRLLYLTCEGTALEERMAAELRQNMKRAYSEAGEEAVRGYWVLMQRLMSPEMRGHFRSFHEASAPDADVAIDIAPKAVTPPKATDEVG